MRTISALLLSLALLTSAACSEAQNDGKKGGGKKGGKKKDKTTLLNPVAGLTKVGHMGGEVKESSGLALGPEAGTYYTHGDDGAEPTLYLIREDGSLVKSLPVPGVRQVDWESLAQDPQGVLYIGDCGNNNNDRRDLTIYRYDPRQPDAVPRSIRFTYPDQQEFPPGKKERNFDCEASLWYDGGIYLFTKDRGQGSTCKVYRLQADGPAKQQAKLLGKIAVAGEVTDAALSPDGRTLALLGREELFLCPVSGGNFTQTTPRAVRLPGAGQTEGAVFQGNNTLIISTEQGNVYRYELAQ
ncbi:esterase-like activity of phytase family protein [Hymenobacter sp. 15J16-1T3B]|uniref:esterase-like activity of phytase family protein n=1 Tax=Hymenobacter sp. 15J16-1T3B TaxID=2886941 RepID=UPI001D1098F8|nr:esterase-like activity of phytase family protein [Hymenobacter sp. 15J16-1T3B]MCC3158842.1 esterase-like activity of phytase family protein [Hymenobacter sp. 15J16-1T3B]